MFPFIYTVQAVGKLAQLVTDREVAHTVAAADSVVGATLEKKLLVFRKGSCPLRTSCPLSGFTTRPLHIRCWAELRS